ncbi:hypothetical protein K437DRAFT_255837 [Tilletiaria anomala UBC 951]|uniref:ATP-NAD kinase n=1 Tax=Tilletiaria anomala (strain ATCC 24038 / CBS 436.72 / UBC 951) TaxID=1037660 RepID=A0A066W9U8_TILAU|nr:uncharacterized protein K437DRAFT_255837 [Tilletiaria anomala UBC 951]KDN47560.1 hypothetical protein K437DRAFT_255837 [Tilletiaria anomala UBC 951]
MVSNDDWIKQQPSTSIGGEAASSKSRKPDTDAPKPSIPKEGQRSVMAHNSAGQPLSSPCFVHACLDRGVCANTPTVSSSAVAVSNPGGAGNARERRYAISPISEREKIPRRSMSSDSTHSCSKAAEAQGTSLAEPPAPKIDAPLIGNSVADPGAETPRISEWSKDMRHAYFEENPTSSVLPGIQTSLEASQAGSEAAQSEEKGLSRTKSADGHSDSDGTVIRAKGNSKREAQFQRLIHAGAMGRYDEEPEHQDRSDDSHDEIHDSDVSDGSSYLLSSGEEDSDDRVRSLTRQLAETAVGVREMSKQLGRARVKSTIQSVLIITKARDNQLIKLTRDLAIWLMRTPRNGRETGLIVYVDSQLKASKRFDVEGIKRDFPALFEPIIHPNANQPHGHGQRRASSFASTPSSGTSSSSSDADGNAIGFNLANIMTSPNGHGLFKGEGQLRYWTAEMCSRHPQLFDFVVTLGGDGTVLFASWMFQRIVPPVLPFSLGSLGFLTNFNFEDYAKVMKSALEDGIRVNLRMRFTATVYRAVMPTSETVEEDRRRAIKSGRTGEIIMRNIQEGGWDRIETPCPGEPGWMGGQAQREKCARRDKEVMCFPTRPVETFEVLNDLVVDRGPSPYVSLLEIFGDEHHMTTAQADGICIATPTGSTAYSLAAGGSLAHPEIPAILITPICPHTLSFRPMLLPDSMEVRIMVPYNSRSTAWASFDGRGRVELKQGDHIKVSASRYPFPTVCAENQSIDWFRSISRTLKWNERQRQKSFVVVEENADQKGETRVSGMRAGAQTAVGAGSAGTSKGKYLSGSTKVDSLAKFALGKSDDENFDIQETSQANTRANSPQPPNADGPKRRSSTHRSKLPSSSDCGVGNRTYVNTPIASRRPADALPRLSAMTPSQFANSLGRRSDAHACINSGSSTSSAHKLLTVAVNADHVVTNAGDASPAPYSSPDRFGKAGPPEPPQALSERHLATADFRLPPSETSFSVSPDTARKNGTKQSGTGQGTKGDTGGAEGRSALPTPMTSLFLAREKICPLAAASHAVRGATDTLTPASLLSGHSSAGRTKKLRPGSKRRGGAAGDASGVSGGGALAAGGGVAGEGSSQAQGAQNPEGLSRKESNQPGGRTALVVYGDDDSDSESGGEERW